MIKVNLTLDEKFKLLTGKNRWDMEDLDGKLPFVCMADGPHGLRKEIYTIDENGNRKKIGNEKTTAYPCLSILSCSFDRDLAYKYAEYIADECSEKGVDILLAPGVNTKRSPLCGRNFEYVSEDPYLAGELAYSYINGLQDRGVGTCLKHYALNNNENYRFFQNVEIDERTMREMYLSQFERALQAKPWSVMCSYNMVNGAYASENEVLLKDILRNDFKYNGVVISDWGAVYNRVKALKATLDLEMPYNKDAYNELKEAYEKGYITDEEIDASVNRLLEMIDKAVESRKIRKVIYTAQERSDMSKIIESESIVMLKNDGVLPIEKGASVEVSSDITSLNWTTPGGSSKVPTGVKVKPISQSLRDLGFDVYANFVSGYNAESECKYQVLCVRGEDEVENEDRVTIKLKPHLENMIIETAKHNSNVIVVIYAGSAIDCSAWIDKVSAVLYVGLAGERGNDAIAEIISGKVNPSGKLSETFHRNLEDYSVDIVSEAKPFVRYSEGTNIGYFYYDKSDKKPLFPFGYGLSYSTFVYSNLKVEKKGELDYVISYDITNTSNVDGKEVSQVYVKDNVCIVERPEKELKGFSKDLIKAGETKRVEIPLNERSFAYYNLSKKKFYVENGKFTIMVGSSSRDIHLTSEIDIRLDGYTQTTLTRGRNYTVK